MRIGHVHIPRTAGTSIRLAAEHQYGKERILAVYGDNIPVARQFLGQQNLNNIAMIRGHIAYGFHEVVGPVDYFTVLRHPLDRLLSLYLYIQKDHGHFAHQETRRMTFSEFVFSGVTAETDNGQVRQLTGLAEFPQRAYVKTHPVGPGDLALALEHLATFALVGIQERFSDVLRACSKMWNWKIVEEPHVNSTSAVMAKSRLSYDDAHRVLTLNMYDLLLWDYARKEFDQCLKSLSLA